MKDSRATEILNELVETVARLFYEDKYVIILDIFTRERVFRDDVLSYRLKMNSKEINRILAKLKEDRLLKMEIRFEKNSSFDSTKTLTKSYYYLDYKQFVDVVKYRIFKMRKYFEDLMRSDVEHVKYLCKKCGKTYNSLEIQSMIDPVTFLFQCELCKSELVEHRNERLRSGPQDAHTRLMDQCSLVIGLLRQTEQISISHFDVVKWIEMNPDAISISIPENISASASSSIQDTSLATESAIDQGKKNEPVIDVALVSEDYDKLENGAKNALTSYDNSMPAWHTHSTVTGDKIFKSTAANQPISPIAEFSNKYEAEERREMLEKHYEEYAQIKNKESMQTAQEQSLNSTEILVEVAGISKPFHLVTEEDKNNMSADEYSKYYQIYMESQ